MPVKLILDHISQPCRAVHLLLLETGIPFTLDVRLISKEEHRAPDIKQFNPNQQLPIIVEDDGFSVFESHAIMRYLCDKYQVPDHWFPKDVKQRAKVDEMLDWHHGSTRRGAAGLIRATLFAKFFNPNITPKEQDEQKAAAIVILKQALKRIDSDYLRTGPFLNGMNDITIADLSAAQEIVMLDLVGFQYAGTAYPNIQRWLERVRARTGKNWAITNAALDKVVAKNREKAQAKQQQVGANKTAVASSSVALSTNPTSNGAWSAAGNALQTGSLMTEIRDQLSGPEGASVIKRLQATFKFVVGDPADKGAAWLLDLKNGGVKELIGSEITETKADTTFTLTDANFVQLATGKINPQVAFMGGKLKLNGNLPKAMAFNTAVFQNPTIKTKIQEAAKKISPTSKL